MTEGRFLTGSTMGHVVRMSATGAIGITFVFLVDAANLFWLSQIGQPKLVAAIGFAYAIQFFSVSVGVGLMIAVTNFIHVLLVQDYLGPFGPYNQFIEITYAFQLPICAS